MKLISQQKDYRLLWKCHGCGRWNRKDWDTCIDCDTPQPILPEDAKPRQQLKDMLKTCAEYARDRGMLYTEACINGVVFALMTESEGYLRSTIRGFVAVHVMYLNEKEFEEKKDEELNG